MSLHPGPNPGTLKAEAEWEERLLSNLGRLEVTGDGSMILASCFNLGVQRYSAEGQNEGSYHLGGTAIHAVPDFPGRSIAVATQEGQLAILNRSGNVRWRAELESPALGLTIDALGRFLIYGLPSGELVRLDLEPSASQKSPKRKADAPRASSNVRRPDWSVPIAKSSDEAEVAVVAVQGEPERIAVLTKGNRFRVFDSRGGESGEGPELRGIGRLLRTCNGWIAAATDRQIVLHESQNQTFHRPDLDLVQVTHLAIRPDTYGLAVVQERDRIGRVTVAGRWVWRKELKRPIEEVAIGPHGLTAYTTDEGVFQVLDAAGEEPARPPFRSEEPLLLVDAPQSGEGTPAVAFVTLSRQAQVLRGHGADGQVRWESPTPWEGWQLHRVGDCLVVVAPDGKVLTYNAEGYLKEQGGPTDSPFALIAGPAGTVLRLLKRDKQLLCATIGGQAVWRAVADDAIGPMAGNDWGVAVYQGLQLCCYRQHPSA
jgi:hypothetical protein